MHTSFPALTLPHRKSQLYSRLLCYYVLWLQHSLGSCNDIMIFFSPECLEFLPLYVRSLKNHLSVSLFRSIASNYFIIYVIPSARIYNKIFTCSEMSQKAKLLEMHGKISRRLLNAVFHIVLFICQHIIRYRKSHILNPSKGRNFWLFIY